MPYLTFFWGGDVEISPKNFPSNWPFKRIAQNI